MESLLIIAFISGRSGEEEGGGGGGEVVGGSQRVSLLRDLSTDGHKCGRHVPGIVCRYCCHGNKGGEAQCIHKQQIHARAAVVGTEHSGLPGQL